MTKERPILMNAESVRAILAGRKTQTRRVMRPQPPHNAYFNEGGDLVRFWVPATFASESNYPIYDEEIRVPHRISDLLWVRETWRVVDRDFDPGCVRVAYRATPETASTDSAIYTQSWSPWIEVGNDYAAKFTRTTDRSVDRWRPSIHMPRWASRITLRVTDVRVEWVQDTREWVWVVSLERFDEDE